MPIVGEPFPVITTNTLAMRGSPDIKNTRRLNISGPIQATGTPSLFIASPPSADMPLVIGTTYDCSGDMPIYINGSLLQPAPPLYLGEWQGYANLTIKTTEGTPENTTFPLVLESQLIGSGINTGELFVSGFVAHSNSDATIFVSGSAASAGSPPTIIDQFSDAGNTATLSITNRATDNETFPLYIDKDFNISENTTLYINHRMGSGHLPTVAKGADLFNNNATLFITPPASGIFNMFTSGFDENEE